MGGSTVLESFSNVKFSIKSIATLLSVSERYRILEDNLLHANGDFYRPDSGV